MLVADELWNRTKNCSLEPTDFLEALVRLGDAVHGTGAPDNYNNNNNKDIADAAVNSDEAFEV